MLFSRSLRAFAGFAFGALLAACSSAATSVTPQIPPANPGSTPAPFTIDGFPATFTEYSLGGGAAPIDITIGPDGAAWFGNYVPPFISGGLSHLTMGQLTGTGSTTFVFLPSQFFAGSGGAIASNADRLFTVASNSSLQNESFLMIASAGSGILIMSDISICCDSVVNKMIVGPDGNVWLAGCDESCSTLGGFVEGMTTTGARTAFTLLSFPPSATYSANSIAAGPDGRLYVTGDYTGPPPAPGSDAVVF